MLQVTNISFAYTDTNTIFDLSFKLERGTNLALIGESGCGKSTLLKLIYGLYELKDGRISFNGVKVTGPNHNLVPGMPNMKYLAQDFDLMPFTTVAENVGAFLSNTDPALKNSRIRELLMMVEMLPFASTKVKDLSGGQQQRVALARVLAVEPELLLLDEPFSNIDSFRKGALRRNLFAYLKAKGISCIIATHDSSDSLSFADKTLVLRDGRAVQFQDSAYVYHLPANKYVASLFGEVNDIPARLLFEDAEEGKQVLVYPHELGLCFVSDLEVTVKQCYFKGDTWLIRSVYNKSVVFFNHAVPLELQAPVFLEPSKASVRHRFEQLR